MSYHLAYIHRSEGADSEADENGFAVGLMVEREIDAVTIAANAEYAHVIDAEGLGGQDRDYITGGVHVGWQGWNLALTAAGRDTDGGSDDTVFQVSGGYEFDFGLTVDVAWKTAEEDGVESDTVGVLVAYGFEF